jgi:hypothetical protein
MGRGHRKGAGRARGVREKREDVGRAHDEKRQRGGTAPAEGVPERALELEPGVEWHAGEDAGEVPDSEE